MESRTTNKHTETAPFGRGSDWFRIDRRIAIALAAVALAFSFQALTIRYNYGGNWTGLFCVGDKQRQPPEFAGTYLFRDSWGYDGQAYRLIAHDPLLSGQLSTYVDDPRYRYARILVPGLAYLLALGNQNWIDATYIFVMLAFTFLGTFWLTMIVQREGWPAWTGLLFLILPATLVSLDRLTVDLTMAAFCIGFIALKRRSAGWFVVLTAAPLCRETGYLLIAAACIDELRLRRFRDAMTIALAALPALGWQVWLASRTAPSGTFYPSIVPLGGFVARVLHPTHYPFSPAINALVESFDYVALAGVALALWCLWRLRRQAWEHPELLLCALPVIFVGHHDVWSEAYAYGRTMSPLWLYLAIRGAEARFWWALAPIALIDSRIGLQLGSQLLGIARGLVT